MGTARFIGSWMSILEQLILQSTSPVNDAAWGGTGKQIMATTAIAEAYVSDPLDRFTALVITGWYPQPANPQPLRTP